MKGGVKGVARLIVKEYPHRFRIGKKICFTFLQKRLGVFVHGFGIAAVAEVGEIVGVGCPAHAVGNAG